MVHTISHYERPLEDLTPADVPILRTEVPGPRSRAIRAKEEAHASPGLSALATLSSLAMDQGQGALVRDVDGNVFIDFSSGTVVAVTGHSHPNIIGPIQEAIGKFLHIYDYASQARADFFEYLASVVPESLTHFQMYTGGSETVEAALRLAKSATGRHEFIGLYRGFHGKTLGALALMGGSYKKGFGPLPGGFFLTPNAYCYRCPLGLKYPTCNVACADFITNIFEQETTGDVAAVVVEPIQGAGGVIVPPPEFLPKIADFCKRNGILLYVDEILTSAGRTGKMWASEYFDIKPDIMTMGKGIGSGFPLGVVASREDIMQAMPWAQPYGGTSTYGGSAVAATAGLVTLQTLVAEHLAENAAVVGAHMKQRLQAMQERHPSIGEVRGAGFLIGVEFVQDRETKELITVKQAQQLYLELVKRGVLVANAAPVVRVTPPLVLTKEFAERGLDLFDEALGAFEAACGFA